MRYAGSASKRSLRLCHAPLIASVSQPKTTSTRRLLAQAASPVMDQRPALTHTPSVGVDEQPRITTGRLRLIMGPMFAGKTTELLRLVAEAEAGSRRVAIINSRKDTRYGENLCASHDGVTRGAHSVDRLWDLLHPLAGRGQSEPSTCPEPELSSSAAAPPAGAAPDGTASSSSEPRASGSQHVGPSPALDLSSIDVVAIDEAQFFPDLRAFVLHLVEVEGKDVIAAGLSGDFRRDTFGDLVSLVPLADDVTLRKARCTYCSCDAAFTLRLSASEEQQLVGGADSYQPVCRSHYVNLSQCRKRLLV